jgi:hypothetical protein
LQEKQVAWRRKLANWERGDFCLSESFTWDLKILLMTPETMTSVLVQRNAY